MLSNYKKHLSYIYPIRHIKLKGEFHEVLEIVWEDGRMVLNSNYANYSYGSLHQVFLNAFKQFKFCPNSKEDILILGFGAGSVFKILRQDYSFQGKIIGVEKDSKIISLAREYFQIPENNPYFELLHQDASLYVKSCKEKFNTIVVDIFVELNVPDLFLKSDFMLELKKILKKKRMYLF